MANRATSSWTRAAFLYQHDARALADGSGLSLFDDASPPCPEKGASGKVLELDIVARTATLRHRYLHNDGEMNTPSQGNCQLLDDGGHVVGWGFRPFSASTPHRRMEPRRAARTGRSLPRWGCELSELPVRLGGQPAPERNGCRSQAGRRRRVVHRLGKLERSYRGGRVEGQWRAVGNGLSPLAIAEKIGFETAIDFIGDGAEYFDVDALDANGNVLGRTPQVTIS